MKKIFNANNIFFTANTHFFHENIIKYTNRPFQNYEDVNDYMVYSWNSIVGKDDIVFHLADLIFRHGRKQKDLVESLNGNIHLILGNHDKRVSWISSIKNIKSINNYLEIKVRDNNIKNIILFHYPVKEWNKKYHGSWHLYGHCHGTLRNTGPKSLDCGVDTSEKYGSLPYAPISYLQIKNALQYDT